MLYCSKCGRQLTDEAHFCLSCGAPAALSTEEGRRKEKFDGVVHKCPQCGEVVSSFEAYCPTCGHELRGVISAESVSQLDQRLMEAKSEDERATIIRSFPVPNTREDLLEFIILASANMNNLNDGQELEAWKSKFEQSYQKAKISFGDSPSFSKIEDMRESVTSRMRQEEIDRGIRLSIKTLAHPLVLIVAAGLVIHEIVWLLDGNGFGLMNVIFDALVLWAAIKAAGKLRKQM